MDTIATVEDLLSALSSEFKRINFTRHNANGVVHIGFPLKSHNKNILSGQIFYVSDKSPFYKQDFNCIKRIITQLNLTMEDWKK